MVIFENRGPSIKKLWYETSQIVVDKINPDVLKFISWEMVSLDDYTISAGNESFVLIKDRPIIYGAEDESIATIQIRDFWFLFCFFDYT
jgi:hypothetical protein